MQLNLLRNRSQWNGPSTEILEQAREICQNFAKDGPNSGAFRLLAKMELDLHESEQAMQTLKDDAAYNAQLNHLFESTYADRDLLFNRAEQGEEDLDAEFARLLTRVRGQGNKRAEPSLYREYGNYLLDRKRPAEAIPMFAEALRLTRAFGWTFHEPGLLTPLFNARLEAGDLTGARATLAELDSFLAAHPELPIARRGTPKHQAVPCVHGFGRRFLVVTIGKVGIAGGP